MKDVLKKLLVILLILAVMVYTFLNYRSGRIAQTYLIIYLAIL